MKEKRKPIPKEKMEDLEECASCGMVDQLYQYDLCRRCLQERFRIIKRKFKWSGVIF